MDYIELNNSAVLAKLNKEMAEMKKRIMEAFAIPKELMQPKSQTEDRGR